MNGVIKLMGVLMAVLFALSFASAVSVSGSYYVNTCQCETTKQIYSVCADVAGVYSVSATGDAAKWVTIAPSSVSLAAGECGDTYVFVTPECYANANTYYPRLIVIGPTDSNAALEIKVNQCHTLDFSVTPLMNVSNPCVENVFNIHAKNTGVFRDEYVLFQTGLPAGWANYNQEHIILNAGEELNTQLKVKSTCNAQAGDYNFNLSMANTRTNVSDAETLIQRINKFSPISLNSIFSNTSYYEAKTCEEFDKNVVFFAANLGDRNDQITLSLLDANYAPLSKDVAYLAPTTFELDINNPVAVSFLIKKHSAPARVPIIIRAYSKNYDMTLDATIDIVYEDCYNTSIVRTSVDVNDSNAQGIAKNVCLGNRTETVLVKNAGTQSTDVNVVLKEGTIVLETRALTLDANTSREISFVITPTTYGQKVYTISVVSAFVSADTNFAYNFEKCFDAQLSANNVLVCKRGNVDQSFAFVNNGSRAQTFTLSIDSNWLYFSPSQVTLAAGETKNVLLVGSVPAEYALTQVITATSADTTITKTVSVVTLSNEECSDMVLVVQPRVDANCCAGQVIPLVVKNNGYFEQFISVTTLVPPWVTISDSNLNLLPKKEVTTYVYLSPPAGSDGNYVAQIRVSNDRNVTRDVNFVVHVSGGNCGPALGADVNIANNVTTTNEFTRKDVTIDFVVTNDSNVGFNVNDIVVDGYTTKVDFNRGTFLGSGQSLTAKLTVSFPEGQEPADANMSVIVRTSVGDFTKNQVLKFNTTDAQGVSIAGWFSGFAAPLVGLLILVLLVLIVVALRAATKTKPKLRK